MTFPADVAFPAFRTAFTNCTPPNWLPIRLTYRRKSCLLLVNSAKQLYDSFIRCCFRSIVSKRGTHLEQTFLMLNAVIHYDFKILKMDEVYLILVTPLLGQSWNLQNDLVVYHTKLNAFSDGWVFLILKPFFATIIKVHCFSVKNSLLTFAYCTLTLFTLS